MNAPQALRKVHPGLFGWAGAITGKTTRLLREVWGPQAYAHVHVSHWTDDSCLTNIDLWDGTCCLTCIYATGNGLGALREVNKRARRWIENSADERKAAQGIGRKTLDQARSDSVNKRCA